MSENKFIEGLYAKAPHQNAPGFVKAKVSIKRKELGNWLRAQDGEWINLDLKESKEGKWYFAVDDFVPNSEKKVRDERQKADDDLDDDIPF